jgi:hypothetical protein
MKKILLFFAFIVLILSTNILLAQFQGTVEVKETNFSDPSNAKPTYSKLVFLGSDIRIEDYMDDSKSPEVAILKSNEKKIIVFIPEEKQYMEIDFQAIIDIAKALQDFPHDHDGDDDCDDHDYDHSTQKSNIDANKSGKSTTLHGFKCEEYIYNNDETISTAWICQNFANFWKMFQEITASLDMKDTDKSKQWYTSAMSTNGFPFKVTEKTKNGEMISEWEVIKIDKTKPSSNLFQIPKGYKEIKLEDMFYDH